MRTNIKNPRIQKIKWKQLKKKNNNIITKYKLFKLIIKINSFQEH